MTHFIKKAVYLFNGNVKLTLELYFVDTLASEKNNKALITLPLCLYKSMYTALDESLVTSIALSFASCYIYLPIDSHLGAVFFIQTGGSALRNVCTHMHAITHIHTQVCMHASNASNFNLINYVRMQLALYF